jgi:hypothetical protein
MMRRCNRVVFEGGQAFWVPVISDIIARMLLLQALRQSKWIARCVLVWFALSMAVAVAAPVVNPQATVLVCSAAGAVKLVNAGDDVPQPMAQHGLDCVLCLALNAPPATPAVAQVHQSGLSFALKAAPVAFAGWHTASPPPARGPPDL